LIGSWDGQMHLWDLKSGTLIGTFIGHVATPDRMNFAFRGHRLVSSGSDAIKIWNTETGGVRLRNKLWRMA
jgi:WD40 repeat protein